MGTLLDVYAGLRTALLANTTLAGLVGERVYAEHAAPEFTDPLPRLLFGLVSETTTETGMRFLRFQFRACVADSNLGTAWAIQRCVADTLHSGNVEITGWRCYWINREGSQVVGSDEFGVFEILDDYTISALPVA